MSIPQISIRDELPQDFDEVRNINVQAFGSESEANLVNALRNSGIPYISLVYEQDGKLLGHILFTPVDLLGDTSGLRIIGLGPMAVLPTHQNQGVGSALVKAGIQRCLAKDYDAIVVLGHAHYYPRFGFVPSVQYGITSEYKVPDDVFMILELKQNALQGRHGTIKYQKAFAEA